MRGVPLTPGQIERAAQVYARTGNYSAAARAIGAADPSSVRQALLRHGHTNRNHLHARACERGLHKARSYVERAMDRVEKVLTEETEAGCSLEPPQLAQLSGTIARLAETMASIADREDRRRTQKLTRAKTRAEVDQIRGKTPPQRFEHGVRVEAADPKALHDRLAALVARAAGETDPGATGETDPEREG